MLAMVSIDVFLVTNQGSGYDGPPTMIKFKVMVQVVFLNLTMVVFKCNYKIWWIWCFNCTGEIGSKYTLMEVGWIGTNIYTDDWWCCH